MSATPTSIEAFHSIKIDREAQVKRLYEVYSRFGPMSDREASYKLGWYPSQVSARRNALVASLEVAEMGKKRDQDTGKTVNVYGIIKSTLF